MVLDMVGRVMWPCFQMKSKKQLMIYIQVTIKGRTIVNWLHLHIELLIQLPWQNEMWCCFASIRVHSEKKTKKNEKIGSSIWLWWGHNHKNPKPNLRKVAKGFGRHCPPINPKFGSAFGYWPTGMIWSGKVSSCAPFRWWASDSSKAASTAICLFRDVDLTNIEMKSEQ